MVNFTNECPDSQSLSHAPRGPLACQFLTCKIRFAFHIHTQRHTGKPLPMPRVVFTQNIQRHVACPPSNVAGSTVREVLDAVFATNQQARGYVLDEHGAVRCTRRCISAISARRFIVRLTAARRGKRSPCLLIQSRRKASCTTTRGASRFSGNSIASGRWRRAVPTSRACCGAARCRADCFDPAIAARRGAAAPTAFGPHTRRPKRRTIRTFKTCTAWFVPGVKDEHRLPPDGKVVVARTRDGGQNYDILRHGLPQDHAYDLTYRHSLAIVLSNSPR
jgi:hypothetical protein